MRIPYLLTTLAVCGLAHAAEGMWTLDNLPTQRIEHDYGFAPDAAWVDRLMHASVRIAGGCSASFVSKDGLVMTNHHCAAQCVEQLSNAAMDYAQDGFLAKKRLDEVRCPEIELNRLEQIRDVTDQVTSATRGLQGEAYKNAQNAAYAKLTADCVGRDTTTARCDVVDLYHGGRYHLYRYHRYQDTRLVWVPEKAAAFFGGDPDNFNFPRYNLDIALLRAYEDGKPAVVKDYLAFSKNGAQEHELVFVTGHPGTTDRQLTVSQLSTLRDVRLLGRLLELAELRGVLEQYAKSGAEAARTSEQLLSSVENSFKAIHGEFTALLEPALQKRKQEEEDRLRRFVAGKPKLKSQIGGAWDAIDAAQQSFRQVEKPYTLLEKGRGLNSRYFSYARTLVRAAQERLKPNAERLPEFVESKLPEVEQRLFSSAPVYAEFEQLKLGFSLTKMREWLGPDDPVVRQVLGKNSPDQLAAAMIAASRLSEVALRRTLWAGGQDAIAKSDDPFIKLALALDPVARAIRKRYEKDVESVEQKNSELIARARFAQHGTKEYPDATFTLRLSYGEVRGWDEAGKPVAPFTTLGGAFGRDTGAYPFALPASWHAARGRLNLAQPLNLVTDNDIIGGNSGSPLINRKGEIVGLIFDGNIHSLGGAFWFDPRYNRAVAVDSRAIVEMLKTTYDAPDLLHEIVAN